MGIRKFSKTDSQKVKELILSVLEKEYPFEKKAYSNTDLENIEIAYGGPRDIFFVVEENGELVATAGIKEDTKDTALLRRVFVKPQERKKGYGSMLLEEAMKFCAEKNYSKIVFRTTSKMTGAIALCRKKGFREEDKIDLGGFSIHRFVLKLSS